MDIRAAVKPPANLPEGVLAFISVITSALKDPKSLAPLAEIAEKINGVNKLTQEEADTRNEAIQKIKDASEALELLGQERRAMELERVRMDNEKKEHQDAEQVITKKLIEAAARDEQYDRQRADLAARVDAHEKAAAALKAQTVEVRDAERRNGLEADRLATLRESIEAREAQLRQVNSILGNGHDERANSAGLVPIQSGQRPDAAD